MPSDVKHRKKHDIKSSESKSYKTAKENLSEKQKR